MVVVVVVVVAAVMVVVAVAMVVVAVAMVAGAGRQVCAGRGLVLSKGDVCRSRSAGFFRMCVFEGSKAQASLLIKDFVCILTAGTCRAAPHYAMLYHAVPCQTVP
jgi:hypothetical protein